MNHFDFAFSFFVIGGERGYFGRGWKSLNSYVY